MKPLLLMAILTLTTCSSLRGPEMEKTLNRCISYNAKLAKHNQELYQAAQQFAAAMAYYQSELKGCEEAKAKKTNYPHLQ